MTAWAPQNVPPMACIAEFALVRLRVLHRDLLKPSRMGALMTFPQLMSHVTDKALPFSSSEWPRSLSIHNLCCPCNQMSFIPLSTGTVLPFCATQVAELATTFTT